MKELPGSYRMNHAMKVRYAFAKVDLRISSTAVFAVQGSLIRCLPADEPKSKTYLTYRRNDQITCTDHKTFTPKVNVYFEFISKQSQEQLQLDWLKQNVEFFVIYTE